MNTPSLFAFLLWLHASVLHVARAEFYYVVFNPSGPVTKFESTIVVPQVPTGTYNESNAQAIWPGLQNSGGLLQNTVETWANFAGPNGGVMYWMLLPYYCCQPAKNLAPPSEVYPGDLVKAIYNKDLNTNFVLDKWVISRGSIADAAGQIPISGSVSVNDTNQDPSQPWQEQIQLSIEVQGAATWNWGSVEWREVLIVAQTTSTDWCNPASTGGPMQWNSTQPVATQFGNLTSCYIAQMIFESPDD